MDDLVGNLWLVNHDTSSVLPSTPLYHYSGYQMLVCSIDSIQDAVDSDEGRPYCANLICAATAQEAACVSARMKSGDPMVVAVDHEDSVGGVMFSYYALREGNGG
jgi:hypothetical protein